MSAPQRIQRKRTKGWRMPEGAIYVGRPTEWGNPYRIRRSRDMRFPGHLGPGWVVFGNGKVMSSADDVQPWTREYAHQVAVEEFRWSTPPRSIRARDIAIRLGGRDLACWCPLDQPCHADVLLELANA